MLTQSASTNVLAFSRPKKFTWDEPDTSLMRATQTPVPTFPRKLFGPVWDQWVASIADSKNAPYDYVAASLLTTAAALIGNAREIRVGGWKEPSILWTVLVGNPSSSKSPAMDPLRDVIEMLECEERQSSSDDESAGPSIQIDDVTAQAAAEAAASNPKGLILFRDELSGWWEKFRQHGGETFWLESYGGRSHNVRRKKQPTLHIPRLAISVLGGSQPDTLRTFLTAKQNRGLAARWLYVCPAQVATFKLGKAVDIEVAYANLSHLRALPLVNGRPVAVDLARQSKPRFEAWAAAKVEQSRNDDESVWGQWIGKQRGVALRLALVLEHLWWAADPKRRPEGPGQVTQAALSAAMRFIDDYASPMATVALNSAARPAEDQDARMLLALLRRKPCEQFNARDLRRGSQGPAGRLANPEAMSGACILLLEAHLIRFAGVRAGEHKGRRPSVYEVNPVVFESEFQR